MYSGQINGHARFRGGAENQSVKLLRLGFQTHNVRSLLSPVTEPLESSTNGNWPAAKHHVHCKWPTQTAGVMKQLPVSAEVDSNTQGNIHRHTYTRTHKDTGTSILTRRIEHWQPTPCHIKLYLPVTHILFALNLRCPNASSLCRHWASYSL